MDTRPTDMDKRNSFMNNKNSDMNNQISLMNNQNRDMNKHISFMNKRVLLIVLLVIIVLLLGGCFQEKEPNILISDLVDLRDENNHYLVIGIAVKDYTDATRELTDVWIDVPYDEIIIAERTNVYSVESVLNQNQYNFPVQIVEDEYFHIIFSATEDVFHNASRIRLDFNDYVEEIEL